MLRVFLLLCFSIFSLQATPINELTKKTYKFAKELNSQIGYKLESLEK